MDLKPAAMRRIRIVGDGKPNNTFVYDAVSGERLDWIKQIKLDINPDRVACELTVLMQVVEFNVDAGVDEPLDIVVEPVHPSIKLPPCETVDVDFTAAADVPMPEPVPGGVWPFPKFAIGAAK